VSDPRYNLDHNDSDSDQDDEHSIELPVSASEAEHVDVPSDMQISHSKRNKALKIDRLSKILDSFADMPKIKWLDKLTFQKIEKINKESNESDTHMKLIVDLQDFQRPVVFHQRANAPKLPLLGDCNAAAVEAEAFPSTSMSRLIILHDPEASRESPVAHKIMKLERSITNGQVAKELKPDSAEKRQIAAILRFCVIFFLPDFCAQIFVQIFCQIFCVDFCVDFFFFFFFVCFGCA
jgi:hypothetical protein